MRIHYILMLSFILGLFGCKKPDGAGTTAKEFGPFTIETIVRTGKRWNINYGNSNYTDISYRVKFNGAPLDFGDSLETNTGIPGIWRVFTFDDAPEPTLLIGSQSLYLVTAKNDQAVIRPLHVQGSDFASIQWLDEDQGQPGLYRELYASDQFDKATELTGGRYLALSKSGVLDTRTFELFSFNTDFHLVEGYYSGGSGAVAFSPDSTQVVYYGSKQDAVDNMKVLHGLVSYEFRGGEEYAVSFDADALGLKDPYAFPLGWMQENFEWIKTEDGKYRLQVKKQDGPRMYKGNVVFRRNQGYLYGIDPVKETLMPVLAEYIKNELHLTDDKVVRTTGDFNNQYSFDVDGKKLVFQYGQYGNDLELREEYLKENSAAHKTMMLKIANGFNALLMSGQYQDLFMEDKKQE